MTPVSRPAYLLIGGLLVAVTVGALQAARSLVPRREPIDFYPTMAVGAPSKNWVAHFGTLEDPDSAIAHRVLMEVEKDNHGRLWVLYKHLPADDHVGLSASIADAAACAESLGAFWPFVTAAYDQQARWWLESDDTDDALRHVAHGVGLSTTTFRDCVRERRARPVVDRDIREAARMGVQAGPTIIMNGRRLFWEDADDLRAQVEARLNGEVP